MALFGDKNLVVWTKITNSSVKVGEEQETSNVRMGSMPYKINTGDDDLFMVNVLHSDLTGGDDWTVAQQGTAFACDLRLSDIATENVLLRPMAIQGFYSMEHRRTKNHVSHCNDVRNTAEVAPDNTFFWANPARGRIFSAVRNEDLKPRTYSLDGIDSLALTHTGQAHYEHDQLGDILHIGEGIVHDYDGCRVVENGFLWHPKIRVIAQTDGAGLPPGTYSWTAVYEHRVGDRVYRSAPAVPVTVTVTATTDLVDLGVEVMNLTQRTSIDNNFSTKPLIVLYRTLVDTPGLFHRVGTIQPDDGASTSAGAREIDPTVRRRVEALFRDITTDAIIEANEFLYTDGGILDNFPAPSPRLLWKHGNRVFVVSGEDPRRVYPSSEFVKGDELRGAIAFNELISFRVDIGEDITAGHSLDEKNIMFTKTQIVAVYGDGPNDRGEDGSFSNPRLIPGGTGCIEPRSVVLAPQGLFFQSDKGMQLLTRGLEVIHIGAPAEVQFDSSTIVAAVVSKDTHQIVWTLDTLLATNDTHEIVYDYEHQQWVTREFNDGGAPVSGEKFTDATDRLGTHTLYTNEGVTYDQTPGTFTDSTGKIDYKLTTGWLHPAGSQGFIMVDSLRILGRRLSADDLTVTVAYDYDDSDTETATILDAALNVTPMQLQYQLKRKECEAIKVTITDEDGAQTGEGVNITSMLIEYQVQTTPRQFVDAQQKALT